MTEAKGRAAQAHAALIAAYWDPGEGLFRPGPDQVGAPFHYWWQAHALDALVDAHARDGDPAHRGRAFALLTGIVRRNGGLTNDFYDDMAWLALAALRAWEAWGQEAFLDAARTLWHDVRGGWNDACGGGLAWRKSTPGYKNAPANAPAALLGARLHRLTGEPGALDEARRISSWLGSHLVDPQSGFVWDGVNRTGDGDIDRSWRFTYNQGVVVAAALELWALTGEAAFREQAARTVAAARREWPGGLPDEGGGDGGLFKGILTRHFADCAARTGDRDLALWLCAEAERAWSHRHPALGLCGPSWGAGPAGVPDLSAALSGVMVQEAAARLAALKPVSPTAERAP